MAVLAVDSVVLDRILHDLWFCLNESSQIAVDSDVLDRLIRDQFQNSELNEIGREFLVESYKDSLLEKTIALEESLQLVLDQLRKLSKSQSDNIATEHLLSVFTERLSLKKCKAN